MLKKAADIEQNVMIAKSVLFITKKTMNLNVIFAVKDIERSPIVQLATEQI